MIMSSNKIQKENGSYTIEASITLVVFMIAIMFIYTQIKVMVCESIMQHAVDNMAAEMSTYVYVLDRAGLIIDTNPEDFKDLDNAIYAAGEAYGSSREFVTGNIDTFANVYSALEGGNVTGAANTLQSQWGEMSGDAGSMVDSIKNLVKMLKTVDWKQTSEDSVQAVGANALKRISNEVLSNFYNWKLESYLPTDRDKFCKNYLIAPESVNFKYSRIFPTSENNNIVVAVSYETKPAFKMFPLKRKVVKVACTAAWVTSNTNNLKNGG